MGSQELTKTISWIILGSIIATIFYTIIFSSLHEPIRTSKPWGVMVLGSIIFNGGSLYCDKEGERVASYLLGVSGLLVNLIFLASALGFVMGPQSTLYHLVNDSH